MTSTSSPLAGDPPPRPYGPVGLVLSVVLIFAVALLLMVLAGGLALAVSALAIGWQETLARGSAFQQLMAQDNRTLQRFGVVTSLVLYAALCGGIGLAARVRGGRHWRELVAWCPWTPFRGSRLFWTVVPATIAYSVAADVLVSKLYPPSQDWIKLPAGPLWIVLFILLAVVFAPVTEELFFRGWLYTSLRVTPLGRWGANLLTSVLFALAHWEHTHIYALVVFPVGVALALVRERTGSIRASMTFHAMFNGVASLLLASGF